MGSARLPAKTLERRYEYSCGKKDYGDRRLGRSASRWPDHGSLSAPLVTGEPIIIRRKLPDTPATSCWLVWRQVERIERLCRLPSFAWTNLPKAVRRLRYLWNGCMRANGEQRGDHPTQKPLGVMAWALQQLPPGCRMVIDPLMGSGTTGVACVKAGLTFTGIEREERYFEAACRRIEEAYRQPRLFAEPAPEDRPAEHVRLTLPHVPPSRPVVAGS